MRIAFAVGSFALGGLAFVVACSSFGSGDNGSSSPPDAAASAEDAAISVPVDRPDAELLPDAGEALPGAYCLARPTSTKFCRDFDTTTDPFIGWTRKYFEPSTNAPTLSTENAPKSAPHALRFTLPAQTDQTSTYALVEARVADVKKIAAVDFELDLFFTKPAWDETHRNLSIASLVLDRAQGTPYEIFLVAGRTNVGLHGSLPNGDDVVALNRQLTYGRWIHLRLSIGAPSNGLLPVELFEDGQSLLAGNLAYVEASFETLWAGIGIRNWNPPNPAFDLRYDNVELILK